MMQQLVEKNQNLLHVAPYTWRLARVDWQHLNSLISPQDCLDAVTTAPTVDNACDNLVKRVTDAVQAHIPRRATRQACYPPWLSLRLLQLIREKNAAYRRWKNSQAVSDYWFFTGLRRQVHQDIRTAKRTYVTSIFSVARSPADFWKNYRLFRPENRAIPTLVDASDKPYFTSSEKASILQQTFLTNFNSTIIGTYSPPPPGLDDFFDDFITKDFVNGQLTTLRLQGSPGLDGLTPAILRNLSPALTAALTALINRSILEECFPAAWKRAKIVPVPKPGD